MPHESNLSAPTTAGMPMLGLGTWQNTDEEGCADSVATALEKGYRHIDTAQAYDNEEYVGEGIERADVDREDIFLATKVWIDSLDPAAVRETTQGSLDRLGVDYIDLLYVHWPAQTYEPEETLPAFEDLREEGLIEHIGVSNFEPEDLENAREVLDAPIFANQVEMHPLLPQEELRSYHEDTDIELVAYSPLARGEVFEIEEIQDVARKHGVSEAQVSLAWLRDKGVTAIPKASSVGHITDNWQSLGVTLQEEDVLSIDGISTEERQVDPGFAPW